MSEKDDIRNDLRDTYDAIAPFFSGTREKVWPPTLSFIREISPCHLGDLGCGTGRALVEAARNGCRVTGVDSSVGQLKEAERNLKTAGLEDRARLLPGDLEDLPLENGELDSCLMIASLHHLPSRELRLKALEEAWRCTKSNGMIQISVWSWDQGRFRIRHLSRLNGERELDDLDGPLAGDVLVPWKKGTEKLRFYHLYGPGELEEEISLSGWTLIRSYFDGRNHWVECERK